MSTNSQGEGIRVLGLDGSALPVAAFSELFCLEQIAHRWVFDLDSREGKDVCVSEMFDIVGGCGIGGFYAILFTALNMTIGQVVNFHKMLMEKVFMSESWTQKDHQGCSGALDNALDEMLPHLGISVDLNSCFISETNVKCLIVVLNSVDTPLPRILRSYRSRESSGPRCTIRQALHATLADLDHLPAVSIEDEEFISASVRWTNPSRELMKELAAAFPKSSRLACFANLGAGLSEPVNDSQLVARDLLSQFQDLKCFFRLSVGQELRDVNKIKTFTMGYLQDEVVDSVINDVVQALTRRPGAVSLVRLSNFAGEDGESRMDAELLRVLDETDREILEHFTNWLSSGYYVESELSTLAGSHTSESGRWLIETDLLKKWMSGQYRVLFLKGPPGCGKTILASIVSLHIRLEKKLPVFSVFIKYSSTMTIDVILSRLAVQFLTRASSITHQLRSLQKRKEMKTEILAEFITAALKSISSPTFLVLDALDEFPSSSRLSLIRTLLELSPDLHLFVTSRHIPDGLLHASLQATIELKESNRTDLEDYIQSKIDNLGFQATADAKAALAGCVMKASSGIFLLAYLHISELSRCRSLFRARDVAMKLATTPRERYDHSVERLQAKDNHDRLLAIHTLMWTWAAKRPLTLEELCLAVASSTEDLRGKMVEEAVVPGRILLELCDGLVVAGRDNVEFVHVTVQEYLDSNGAKIFDTTLPRIGPGCLGYLAAKHPPGAITEWFWKYHVYTMTNTSDSYQFFWHCALFWGDYAREYSANPDSDVVDGFLCLLEQGEALALCMSVRFGQREPIRYTPLHLVASFGLATCVRQLLHGPRPQFAETDDCGRTACSWACGGGYLDVVNILLARDDAEANYQDFDGRSPLLWACKEGHKNVVRSLIARDDVVADKPDLDGRSPLLWACMNGHLDIVRALLSRDDVNANCLDRLRRSPLSWASARGHLDIVKFLLAREKVVSDSSDLDGRSPLSLACVHGHLDIVKCFLPRGDVNVNSHDHWRRSPLWWACENGQLDMVKLLLGQSNVDVNSADDELRSPLWWACKKNDLDVVQCFLIRDDVMVNFADSHQQSPLLWACRNGYFAVAKCLLSRTDIDVNARDSREQSPLWWACRNGHLRIVNLLVALRHVNVNCSNVEQRSPLWWACRNGHLDVVRCLLARNDVNVNFPDKEQRTPLLWACGGGDLEVVKNLLTRSNVNLNHQDIFGRSPLWWACSIGHLTIVNLLLAHCDVDVNLPDNTQHTPLSWACMGGHLHIVKLLLTRQDINVNLSDTEQRSPLHWAWAGGYFDVVNCLLDRGDVNVNFSTNEQQSIFMWACQQGHKAIVTCLLARKDVNVNCQDKLGRSPFSWACGNGHHLVVGHLLAHENVDFNHPDAEQRSPLWWACRNGQLFVVMRLLAQEAINVNLPDNEQQSPLLWASKNGWLDVLTCLLTRKDVNINFPDDDQRSPVSWACLIGRLDVVKVFLSRDDVNINSQDVFGRSPLWWACGHGHLDVVKILLTIKNIDVNLPDLEQHSPLSWACVMGHLGIVELLLDRDDININFPDDDQRSPLWWACKRGHRDVVKCFLTRHDVEINARDNYGESPFSQAWKMGHFHVTKLLFARDDVEVDSQHQWSNALHSKQTETASPP